MILLLPGSRMMEIEKLLPVMLEAAKIIHAKRPDIDFAMPRATTIELSVLEEKINKSGLKIKITEGDVYDIMHAADFGIATSGTVTLEAALCGLGCEILYKTSPITFAIAKRVVEIPYIGLPNIVAGRQVEPEILQDECTPEVVAETAFAFLEPKRHKQLKEDLLEVRHKLGDGGAVEKVAALVLREAENKQ